MPSPLVATPPHLTSSGLTLSPPSDPYKMPSPSQQQRDTIISSSWLSVTQPFVEQYNIQSLELRCFRKILGISYKDRITNEHL